MCDVKSRLFAHEESASTLTSAVLRWSLGTSGKEDFGGTSTDWLALSLLICLIRSDLGSLTLRAGLIGAVRGRSVLCSSSLRRKARGDARIIGFQTSFVFERLDEYGAEAPQDHGAVGVFRLNSDKGADFGGKGRTLALLIRHKPGGAGHEGVIDLRRGDAIQTLLSVKREKAGSVAVCRMPN